ncbi:MAG: hypothetical protein AB7F64_01710 [Gammaproteobacteria bacterium]
MIEFNFLRKKNNDQEMYCFLILTNGLALLLLIGLYFFYYELTLKEKHIEKKLLTIISSLNNTIKNKNEMRQWVAGKIYTEAEMKALFFWLKNERFKMNQIKKIESNDSAIIIYICGENTSLIENNLLKKGFNIKSADYSNEKNCVDSRINKIILNYAGGVNDHL